MSDRHAVEGAENAEPVALVSGDFAAMNLSPTDHQDADVPASAASLEDLHRFPSVAKVEHRAAQHAPLERCLDALETPERVDAGTGSHLRQHARSLPAWG